MPEVMIGPQGELELPPKPDAKRTPKEYKEWEAFIAGAIRLTGSWGTLERARNAALRHWLRSRAATIASTAAIRNAAELDGAAVPVRAGEVRVECGGDRAHQRPRVRLHRYLEAVLLDQPVDEERFEPHFS